MKKFLIVLMLTCNYLISYSQTAEDNYKDGLIEFNQENYIAAIKYFDLGISKSKEYPLKLYYLYLWRAKSEINLEPINYLGAMRDLNLSINSNPKAAEPHYWKAIVYSRINKVDSLFYCLNVAYQMGYKNDSLACGEDFIALSKNIEFNNLLIRNGQEPCKESGVYKQQKLQKLMKEIVENKINSWQKKGKYEKSADYIVRVSESTREQQIKLVTQQVLDSIASSQMQWTNPIIEYDADNESFSIKFISLPVLYLKVPINEAQIFGENFNQIKIYNPKFSLSEDRFVLLHLEFKNSVNNKTYVYDVDENISFNPTQLALNFDEINISLPKEDVSQAQQQTGKILSTVKSDVDINIPVDISKNSNRYALIIGNEDYNSFQNGLSSEVNVSYAANDARIFKEYAVKILGIPEENITLKINARVVEMNREIEKLRIVSKNANGEAEFVFYYAGHGFPDEISRESFLMPVDVSANDLQFALRLSDIYKKLTEYPSKRVTVFLDACFSGGARNQSLLAARGVKIKPKDDVLGGNLVVFAASSGEQSALPYSEKGHGMFSYFLFKKLQEANSNLTYGDLADYLMSTIGIKSVMINNKEQNPSIHFSPAIENEWRSYKIN